MKFSVMWKNEITADVNISDDLTVVFIKKYSTDCCKMPFGGSDNTIERVYNFLAGRWISSSRADIKDRLSDIGLEEYNLFEIVKKTHGVMWEDFLWIKFEDENLSWEAVRIRE